MPIGRHRASGEKQLARLRNRIDALQLLAGYVIRLTLCSLRRRHIAHDRIVFFDFRIFFRNFQNQRKEIDSLSMAIVSHRRRAVSSELMSFGVFAALNVL